MLAAALNIDPHADKRMLQLLFIDGIGGRSIFRAALLRQVAKLGVEALYFGYHPSRETLAQIQGRLEAQLHSLAARGPYVLVGYSFGGVLARMAVPQIARAGQPCHLILVASPMHSMALSRRVAGWRAFRWLTGECGALTASETDMATIARPTVVTTCVFGTRPLLGIIDLAGSRPSDGMVSVQEVNPSLFNTALAQASSHPFIATSKATFRVISDCIAACDSRRAP
ncbi:hypothetical protein [Ideonella sp.]|jgi:hypothetical protein|uniref:hypothetical protein n=1 Tax=Ideonella sp. TaxID=1929293 RepID=UPI0037C0BF6C